MYIDDACQFTARSAPEDAISSICHAVGSFSEGSARLKLTLSDKAAVVSHPPWIAVKISWMDFLVQTLVLFRLWTKSANKHIIYLFVVY